MTMYFVEFVQEDNCVKIISSNFQCLFSGSLCLRKWTKDVVVPKHRWNRKDYRRVNQDDTDQYVERSTAQTNVEEPSGLQSPGVRH